MLPHSERGAGPVVALLHAGVGDRSMWDEHLEWLAGDGYRAMALDLPGFGEAPVTTGPQAPWEDVLGTLRELDVDRAALVGNSFGAAVALRVAAVAPAAASALVLISPPPLARDPSPELRAAWEAEEEAVGRGALDEAVEAVVQAWLIPEASPVLRDRVRAMQRRALTIQMVAADVEEAPDPLERDTDALRRMRIPVLAAAGERDMPDFKEGAQEIAGSVPRGRTVVIRGAGHLAPLEAPDEFRALLTDFLSTVI